MIKYTQNKIYLHLYSLTKKQHVYCKAVLKKKKVLLACFNFQLVFLNSEQNQTNLCNKKQNALKHIQHFRMKT